jgi:tetratricopeptide (TPR) repeat protein
VLTMQKDFVGAEKVYRQALVVVRQKYGDQHPETALLLRNLGDVLNAQGKLDEARAMHSQALATRASLLDEVHPLLADSFERLGVVTLRQGGWADAETLFRKAIVIRQKLSPNDPREWEEDANSLADALNGQLKFEASVRLLTELISTTKEGDPRAARLYAIRGKTYGRGGNWSEAAKDFRIAEHLEPTNHWHAYLLAPLLLETKDVPAYQSLCRQSLVHFVDTGGDTASQVALMNLLGPDSSADLSIVHALADRAMSTAGKRGNAYYIATKALAELRSHEPARAIERLEALLADLAAGRLQGGRFIRVQSSAILAMAHHAQGHAAEARQALNQARTVAPTKIQTPPNGDYGPWHEWLILQLHLREATSLIEGARH